MSREKERTFTCGDLAERHFHHFEDMRKAQKFFDITFLVRNEPIYAHRIVIVSVIPRIRNMLWNKDVLEVGETVTIPDVEPEAFRSLIEYAYVGRLKITVENAVTLLSTACALGVVEVQDACCDFLGCNLDPSNIMDVRAVARSLKCLELLNNIECYIKQNFMEIAEEESFLEWPVAYLKDVIEDKDLNVDSEEIVLEAVMKWVKFSPEERAHELPDIFRRIRMHEIDPLYLIDIVRTENLIRTSIVCRDLIDEGKDFNSHPERREDICSFPTEPRRPKKPEAVGDKKEHLRIYKLSAEAKYTVQCFNFLDEKWENRESFSFKRYGGAAAELQKKLYFSHWGDSVQYDPEDNTYKYLTQFPTPVVFMGSVAFNGKVYVLGGRVHENASNAAHCFDPQTNNWTTLRPMRTARWGPSVVTQAEYIFVLGGQDSNSVFASVERYDPQMDKWRTMEPMLAKRRFAGAACLNGKIYICGGSTDLTGTKCVSTAEMFDPMKNKWVFIKPMTSCRRCFTLLPCDGRLYATGGMDVHGKWVDRFLVYDPECDAWTSGPSTLSTSNIAGLVVMSSPMDLNLVEASKVRCSIPCASHPVPLTKRSTEESKPYDHMPNLTLVLYEPPKPFKFPEVQA